MTGVCEKQGEGENWYNRLAEGIDATDSQLC